MIKPAWDTFTSSISGIWKGVGAVFSPFTAEMEPISVNNKRENLYDCYTLSRIEKASPNEVRRTVNWVTLNPFGEGSGADKGAPDVGGSGLPAYESFDLNKSELLEEDGMIMEPGLVFFEVFSCHIFFKQLHYQMSSIKEIRSGSGQLKS